MFKTKRLGVVGLMAALLLVAALPTAQAATLTMLSVTVNSIGATCDTSAFTINFGWLADVSDPVDGNDLVGMIATDAYGVPIAADWNGWAVGNTATETTPFGSGEGINAVTARPITINVYDLTGAFPPYGQNTQAIYDDIAGRGAPLLGQLVYDPADDVPACASLPLIAPAPAAAVPGPDLVPIPTAAVVGAFVVNTPIYWAPRADAATTTVMVAGKTAWVYGVDASGAYYKVMLSGKFFWVPVSTMGPNYDAVWQGRPLPTGVVS